MYNRLWQNFGTHKKKLTRHRANSVVIFKNSARSSEGTHCVSIINKKKFMLLTEAIAVYC
jgi:hypothetical protein